jgi:ATP/maltotriose-dependent transcriptional regulator MalT
VRDVVRARMQTLPDATKELLLVAALIGRDVDLGLLARAATLDVERCLDELEPAMALGVVVTPRDDPFSLRFSHDLVRESIIETAPPLRTPRLHLRIADALDTQGGERTSAAERLAHHLWSAGPLADPGRTSRALIASARRAHAKYAYEIAQQRVELALTLAESAGEEDLELDALMLLTSVVGVRVGYVGAASEHLERAERLARKLGHGRLAADLLYSRWAAESQGIRLDRSGPLAAELLAEGEASNDPVVRTRGFHARGVDCWDRGQIGASLRALVDCAAVEHDVGAQHDIGEPLSYDIHLLSPVFLAHMHGVHGDLDEAWTQFDRIDRTRVDGPYPLMVWGAFVGVTAALSGDVERARRSGERCIDADPDLTFEFLGLYIRIIYWWAVAMAGDHDTGIAEMRRYIAIMQEQTARSGDHTWFLLLGEALQLAGRLDEAGVALAQAEHSIERYGQCYAEPLLHLLRAQLIHQRGGPADEVTALIEQCREMACAREAFLFVQRADAFEATLDG